LLATIETKENELASHATSTIALHEIQDPIGRLQNKDGGDVYALRAEVASKRRSIVDVLYVATVGAAPLVKKAKDFIGLEEEDELEDVDADTVIKYVAAMPITERFFSVKFFKDGNVRNVVPSETDPLDYAEMVSTADDEHGTTDNEHGTVSINIEEFHDLIRPEE
jgi:hypothetical protein